MKISQIYSELIHHKDQQKLFEFEKILTEKIKETKSLTQLEELYFLLLVTKIKNSFVENISIKQTLIKYLTLVKQIETQKKTKYNIYKKIAGKKDYSLIIFYNTSISKLHYLDNLYQKVFLSSYNKNIRDLKYDFKKNLYFEEKKYGSFFTYFFYKWITGYGNGVKNLAIFSLITLILFSTIFFIYDILNPGTLINGFPGMENISVASYEYYIYLSTNILSNLGADGNLAVTPFLRLMFDIEQILGVILFGLFIFIIGKKL
ncbi:MAG: hypothetical protein N4A38_04370 [Candidatus Gracilibacteria bacterium]|nr:hypothetical protein [Candidatus Gracilibacteria bacterium]